MPHFVGNQQNKPRISISFTIETLWQVRIVANYVAIGGGELLSPIMCVTSSAY
jgi:hypothetical protein